MTAIDFAPQLPATRLRLTQRGRRLCAAVVALPVAAVVSMVILSGGSALASLDAGPADAFETVTVAAGDTLWGIAAEVAPAADPRDVVDGIVRLNALEGSTIAAGQRLAIPSEYTSAR